MDLSDRSGRVPTGGTARECSLSAAAKHFLTGAPRGDVDGPGGGGYQRRVPRLVFQAGDAIVREGEVGDAAYVILDGHCQATRVVAGKTQMLRLLGPGEMFGETAVLTGSARSATVTALLDTTVAVVDRLFLQEEMERTSFMALAIRTVASSFLDLNAQTTALLEEQRLNKVVDLTLRHLALWGTDGPGGTRRTPWNSLLTKLAHETNLAPEAIAERLDRQPGFEIVNDHLVLKPPNR